MVGRGSNDCDPAYNGDFFVVTKGVMIVNTKTTYFDFSDTSMTLEEQAQKALELME